MTVFLSLVALALLVNLLASLYRIAKGPTGEDRLLSLQLMGTSATALLLILSVKQDMPALIDAALVIAILSSVTLSAFVSSSWLRDHDVSRKEPES